MSGAIPEAAMEATTYCPTCDPTRDPIAEVLATVYCGYHQPNVTGADDAMVVSDGTLSGAYEAGGESNRHFCALLHRKGE